MGRVSVHAGFVDTWDVEATSAPRSHGLRLPKPRRLLAALSDERLVEYVRGGDAAAFEVLYDRYSGGILGFCRHMLGSLPDAEDAVQHTFIAAHGDIQRHGRRELHVKAWLYTIARNRCLSMLRARREQPSDDGLEMATAGLSEDVEQRAELRALLADVAKLPDDQREALVLAELGDLSHSEISDVLGCEVAKVKSLVFQARTALVDRRIARDTSCEEIRRQIATLRGGALRRSHLRHHIEACPGCAQYRDEVRRQRAMLAVALPVVPSAALKGHILGALGLGGSSAAAGAGVAATAGAGAGAAGIAAQAGVVAKIGIAAALAVGGIGGAAEVVHKGTLPLLNHSSAPQVRSQSAGHSSSATSAPGHGTAGAGNAAIKAAAGQHAVAHARHRASGSRRSASGTQHGFTPTTGTSNGAQARQFALTRGQGGHTGLTKDSTRHKAQHQAKKLHTKHVAAPRVNTAPTAHTQPLHAATPAPTAKTETTSVQAPATQQGSSGNTTRQATITTGTTGKSHKSAGNGKHSASAGR
jgi:RNA polymerase sigma factor (sigma-70 family)